MPPLADLSAPQWLLAALAALCIGLSKGGFGGVSILGIVIMAAIMPARESTGVILPLLIGGDLCAVAVYRRHAEWRHIWRLLPPMLAGIVVGYFMMKHIPDGAFRPIIGGTVLVMVLLQYARMLRPAMFEYVPHARWFAWSMGGASGIATMLANAAGPVMTLYLLANNLAKLALVGTIAWAFLIVNVLKLPFSFGLGLITRESLLFSLILLPAIALGIGLGRWLLGAISQRSFENCLLILAAIVALALIF